MNRQQRRAELAQQERFNRHRRAALAKRGCGGCTVCCTVKGIGELQKPAGEDCPHMAPDRQSCLIYGRHPKSCRGYHCAWRAGFLGDEQRPDRVGVLFEYGRTVLVPGVRLIVAREARPGALSAAAELLGVLASKWIVIKVRGDERTAIGPPEVMSLVLERLKGTDHIQVE